jgi:hypothetical protein
MSDETPISDLEATLSQLADEAESAPEESPREDRAETPGQAGPKPIARVGRDPKKDAAEIGAVYDPTEISATARVKIQKHVETILRDFAHIAIGMDRCLDRGSHSATQSVLAKNAMYAARQSAAALIVTTVTDIIEADAEEGDEE